MVRLARQCYARLNVCSTSRLCCPPHCTKLFAGAGRTPHVSQFKGVATSISIRRNFGSTMTDNIHHADEPAAAETEVPERDLQYWLDRWSDDKIGWHQTKRHRKLEKFQDKMINNRKEVKILFPLCGKAVDMKWMYDEGHTVVGIEVAPKGIEEFFLENDLNYVAEEVKEADGSLYRTEDNRLRLYCCNLFNFSNKIEKDFEAVFDRGSLVAVNHADRERYAELILSLLSPTVRYLLHTYDYDATRFSGSPYYISVEDIEKLYGGRCSLELLEREQVVEGGLIDRGWENVFQRLHLIMFK